MEQYKIKKVKDSNFDILASYHNEFDEDAISFLQKEVNQSVSQAYKYNTSMDYFSLKQRLLYSLDEISAPYIKKQAHNAVQTDYFHEIYYKHSKLLVDAAIKPLFNAE